MSGEAPVLISRHGRTALITLNRPKALNSVNPDLAGALGAALEELAQDDDLWVGVVTGAGRAFCAGADLKAIAARQRLDAPGHPEWGFGGFVRHYVDKPIIAAVNGIAFGGGAEIVLASDLAIADEPAKLGIPEVKRGLIAGAGGVIRLPRQIPNKIASRLAFTGEPMSAVEAAHWGLVNDVVPAGTCVDAALTLAEQICANAPLAVRASKRIIQRGAALGGDWDDEVWDYNDEQFRGVLRSEDAKEGPRAFAEKREPKWQGR
jgi:crotonobetainyl-CoA hydratase